MSDWDVHPPMLALAAQKENIIVVEALLAKGAVPDAHTREETEAQADDETKGKTALMWASENNNVAIAAICALKTSINPTAGF